MSFHSKQDDADLPSYTEAVTDGRSCPIRAAIHDELLNLSVQFSCIQGQKLARLARADEQALNLILPNVKEFLADYSETTLPRATLILVPAGIVSPDTMPADDDLRNRDDFGRVIMVSSEKGGEGSVWSGETMAGRLASNLRPRTFELPEQIIEPYPTEGQVKQVTPNPSRGFWRKKQNPITERVVSEQQIEKSPPTLPKVAMDVKAEEIVFRTENDMGLYETVRIWGLVVRVHVTEGYPG